MLSERISFDLLHFWPQPAGEFPTADETMTPSVLTTAPNGEISELYDRMPRILTGRIGRCASARPKVTV